MTKKIVIIAGHDDDTWETRSSKGIKTDLTPSGVYEEYDSNIVIAREMVRSLEDYEDFTILFPQENGKDMSLRERVDYCNRNNADLAIFVHSNASKYDSASGACAFHHPGSKGEQWAKYYAGEMKKGGYPLWQGGTFECNPNDGWSWFYVIANTNMPSVLPENFFFTNPTELKKYLLDPRELKKIAAIHVQSTLHYFGVSPKKTIVEEAMNEVIKGGITMSVLRKGDNGADVRQLQERLNKLGFNVGQADGDFGPNTEEGVEEMQFAAGITVDGVVGKNTYKALDELEDLGVLVGKFSYNGDNFEIRKVN